MRAIVHVGVSLLLVATLLGGQCLSCPRLFSTERSESCCKPAGCETPKQPEPQHSECASHPESSLTFVKVDAAWGFASDLQRSLGRVELPAFSAGTAPRHTLEISPVPLFSPPDRCVLLSEFRI